MSDTIKILAVGDVVGRPGRQVLKDKLQGIVDMHRIGMVIVNGENAGAPGVVATFWAYEIAGPVADGAYAVTVRSTDS